MRAIAIAALGVSLLSHPSDGKLKPVVLLTSSEFANGAELPTSATCDGTGVSPALAWKGAADSKSFALVVDDPDAPSGPYVHWVIYDVPKGTMEIPRGGSAGIGGKNSADKTGFAPACPPAGTGVHHYRFHLYALDVDTLGLKGGATRAEVEAAMNQHVVADSTLTGTYERR